MWKLLFVQFTSLSLSNTKKAEFFDSGWNLSTRFSDCFSIRLLLNDNIGIGEAQFPLIDLIVLHTANLHIHMSSDQCTISKAIQRYSKQNVKYLRVISYNVLDIPSTAAARNGNDITTPSILIDDVIRQSCDQHLVGRIYIYIRTGHGIHPPRSLIASLCFSTSVGFVDMRGGAVGCEETVVACLFEEV